MLASAPQEVDQLPSLGVSHPPGHHGAPSWVQQLPRSCLCCTWSRVMPEPPSRVVPHPRIHGLSPSAVSTLALRVGSSVPIFLPAMFKCHGSFGGGFFFFFLSFHVHTGLLYRDSKGLKGAFNSLQRRGFVLTIVSSLSLLGSLPPSERQCFLFIQAFFH